MSGRNDSGPSDDVKEELRRMAVESLLKETSKRKQLAESIGSEAFYTTRFCPGKTDQGFVRRQLMHVYGHNKRWEEEKCWTVKKNLDRLDRERRKRPAPDRTDKYKAEKEYWMAEKALKFAKKADMGWEDAAVDRSNMLLFPTIASCTSSESEEVNGDGLVRGGDELSRGGDSSKTTDSLKTTHSSQTRNNPSRDDTLNHDDQDTNTSAPKERRHHHHHRHHHRKPFLVSYQTQPKYFVISTAS